jgi:two-component system sensor histidine kinase/response regulator
MHGGAVSVASQLGAGSTFGATLLCESVDKTSAPAPELSAPEAVPVSHSVRVLVVEDNLVNQKVVTAILRKRKFQVSIAHNGQEALDMIKTAEPFSLVLMDVQMPILDGLETTRMIRADQRWSTLPIIAMTAHAMNGDREKCLQSGMNAYVSKPVHPNHLLTTIDRLLNGEGAAMDRPDPMAEATETKAADSDLLEGMLHLFLALAPERLEKLRTAAETLDARALGAESRKIGAAANRIGAGPIARLAQAIEAASVRKDFDAARDSLNSLAAEIEMLQPAVL